MAEIILYDLPSKGHSACWSLNPWKTRLALNYKSLPYKTQWVEYPSVAPTLQSFGIAPNADGTPYTIPAVRFSDDVYMMDSRKIAAELEKRHPSPPLHLDAEELPKIEKLLAEGMGCMRGVLMPRMPRVLLNPPSMEYFERTREQRFGMPLGQLEKEHGGEEAWEKVKPALQGLGDILRANGGPFVRGKEVSYADFVIVGLLRFLERIGDDIFERAVAIEPLLKTVYDASAVWLERDDH